MSLLKGFQINICKKDCVACISSILPVSWKTEEVVSIVEGCFIAWWSVSYRKPAHFGCCNNLSQWKWRSINIVDSKKPFIHDFHNFVNWFRWIFAHIDLFLKGPCFYGRRLQPAIDLLSRETCLFFILWHLHTLLHFKLNILYLFVAVFAIQLVWVLSKIGTNHGFSKARHLFKECDTLIIIPKIRLFALFSRYAVNLYLIIILGPVFYDLVEVQLYVFGDILTYEYWICLFFTLLLLGSLFVCLLILF